MTYSTKAPTAGKRGVRANGAPPPSALAHTIANACLRMGGISRSTIYNMIKAGRVRTIEIGGRTMVADSECQRVVAEAIAAAQV
jgi:predicted DNA-binding transcriptional regulator AlpA